MQLERGSVSFMGSLFKVLFARGSGSNMGSPFKVLLVRGTDSNLYAFQCTWRVVVVVLR